MLVCFRVMLCSGSWYGKLNVVCFLTGGDHNFHKLHYGKTQMRVDYISVVDRTFVYHAQNSLKQNPVMSDENNTLTEGSGFRKGRLRAGLEYLPTFGVLNPP